MPYKVNVLKFPFSSSDIGEAIYAKITWKYFIVPTIFILAKLILVKFLPPIFISLVSQQESLIPLNIK